jgi:hypothetical protein
MRLIFNVSKPSKLAALLVAPALLVCTTVQTANAAMVATTEVVRAAQPPAADRERVIAFLARADVQEVLERWGVEPEQAELRVASMTDAELAGFAARIDRLPAGGNGTVGAVVGAILLIFIILLITDLLGLTDVFPFVKKRR